MNMNKPLTMVVKETKSAFAKVCNESGLSPVVLDLIMQGFYSEIHTLAERQAAEEERIYVETIKNKDIDNGELEMGDANESE